MYSSTTRENPMKAPPEPSAEIQTLAPVDATYCRAWIRMPFIMPPNNRMSDISTVMPSAVSTTRARRYRMSLRNKVFIASALSLFCYQIHRFPELQTLSNDRRRQLNRSGYWAHFRSSWIKVSTNASRSSSVIASQFSSRDAQSRRSCN